MLNHKIFAHSFILSDALSIAISHNHRKHIAHLLQNKHPLRAHHLYMALMYKHNLSLIQHLINKGGALYSQDYNPMAGLLTYHMTNRYTATCMRLMLQHNNSFSAIQILDHDHRRKYPVEITAQAQFDAKCFAIAMRYVHFSCLAHDDNKILDRILKELLFDIFTGRRVATQMEKLHLLVRTCENHVCSPYYIGMNTPLITTMMWRSNSMLWDSSTGFVRAVPTTQFVNFISMLVGWGSSLTYTNSLGLNAIAYALPAAENQSVHNALVQLSSGVARDIGNKLESLHMNMIDC